jgi:hypothetical protein
MGKLDAVGFGLDGVGEAIHLVQWRFFFSDFVAFPLLVQAWVLAHMGAASIDVLEKLALLVVSKNSSRRVTNGSCYASSLRWVVLLAGPTIRRVQRSIVGSFIPTKIVLPLYLTTHFLLSNFTVHPASVSTCIPQREAMDNSGTKCPMTVVGGRVLRCHTYAWTVPGGHWPTQP